MLLKECFCVIFQIYKLKTEETRFGMLFSLVVGQLKPVLTCAIKHDSTFSLIVLIPLFFLQWVVNRSVQ